MIILLLVGRIIATTAKLVRPLLRILLEPPRFHSTIARIFFIQNFRLKPMASLYFTYSAMNAGKSTSLLQVAYNYEERDQRVLLLTPSIDDRAGAGTIASRLGIERSALGFLTALI